MSAQPDLRHGPRRPSWGSISPSVLLVVALLLLVAPGAGAQTLPGFCHQLLAAAPRLIPVSPDPVFGDWLRALVAVGREGAALEAARSRTFGSSRAWGLTEIGEALLQRGDRETAVAAIRAALADARSVEEPPARALALARAAAAATRAGLAVEGRTAAAASAALLSAVTNPFTRADVAIALLRTTQAERAAAVLGAEAGILGDGALQNAFGALLANHRQDLVERLVASGGQAPWRRVRSRTLLARARREAGDEPGALREVERAEGLLDPRADEVPLALVDLLMELGREDDARRWARAALQHAHGVEGDTGLRELLLEVATELLARTGEVEAARRAAGLIAEQLADHDRAMAAVAAGMAREGHFPEALREARTIPDSPPRWMALADIASQAARRGPPEAAARILVTLDDAEPSYRSEACRRVANGLIERGDLSQAAEVAGRCAEGGDRLAAFAAIVQAAPCTPHRPND